MPFFVIFAIIFKGAHPIPQLMCLLVRTDNISIALSNPVSKIVLSFMVILISFFFLTIEYS